MRVTITLASALSLCTAATSSNMAATPAWMAIVESVMNRNIAQSSLARELAQRLQGKTFQLDIHGMGRVRLLAFSERLVFTRGDDAGADAAISGAPMTLLGLFSEPRGRPLAQGSAQVSGDAEVAAAFRDLFKAARPDIEEELSRWVGDFAAHGVTRVARDIHGWGAMAGRTARANIAEYLQEESRDLVNKTELQEFLRNVDKLRESTDRAEARLTSIEKRTGGGA
jgi:ubiquinone biosynthesis accessory factor UbiJ